MTTRTLSPIAFAEAAVVAIVALWLTSGLLSAPAVLGVVTVVVALPLLIVVVPALVVRAAGDGGVVRVRLRLPVVVSPEERTTATDGGRPMSECRD
ncbi:hypothetical protein N0B31_03465 [Salinirubellus salinus]|uniref:Uncharacterized protein n=1 Tax=Salinirubellus salinus TaxID=1364945 RepID=A0A9E7R3Z8_9EURY|nr:hypothetical protein [Salinirubellus salinus]UWM55349.1 hypothetical protein N0B31_03465 [Salinirubellus salinus]